jgi:hypothetical protein
MQSESDHRAYSCTLLQIYCRKRGLINSESGVSKKTRSERERGCRRGGETLAALQQPPVQLYSQLVPSCSCSGGCFSSALREESSSPSAWGIPLRIGDAPCVTNNLHEGRIVADTLGKAPFFGLHTLLAMPILRHRWKQEAYRTRSN